MRYEKPLLDIANMEDSDVITASVPIKENDNSEFGPWI